MSNDKKKMHPFFKILITLFTIFICFYISIESGYYPSKVQKRVISTNAQLEEFESYIESGGQIDSDGFIEKKKDYSNFVTKAGNSLTNSVGKFLTHGVKGIGKTVKLLFG